ncbi:MAG: hypothetical protein H7177_13020 [Rhizobacter sp.]|nr:hypothetical protein [Bacteriovorax sp.]
MKTLLAIFLLSLSTMSFGDIINVPPIPPTSTQAMCTTDLIDLYGNVVRSFSGNGYDQYEACRQSEQFCDYELQRYENGFRCETRGGGYPRPPRPPQQTTEQCRASRFDPAGFFIQSYYGQATGPWGSNVKDQACRQALQQCSYDLRGRQTCRIDG